MSDVDKPVKLEERTVIGKGLNELRSQGFMPAVIHNHGESSIHVMAPQRELDKIFQSAGKHHPVNLQVGSKKYLALIKDAHFNPVKRSVEHMVFQAIRQNEKVEAEIPIHLIGDAPAEQTGLIILRQLDTVQVEAFPRDLPDSLDIDATKLAELHDKITVGDLKVPEGVTILTEEDHPIATVAETPKQMSEEAEAEGEEGAGGDEESAEGSEAEGAEKDAGGQQAPSKPGE